MATSTSFSPAAALCCTSSISNISSSRCSNYETPSLILSRGGGGDLKWFQPNWKRIVLLHRSNSSSERSVRRPRCYAESNETDSASSPSPPSTVNPKPPSAPLESSSAASSSDEAGGRGEFLPTGQQRKRSQGARREAGSTDWISSSLSRRFGLAGGLAWVGFLAFGVISEQIKTRTEVFLETQGTQNVEGTAKEVVLDNNVKYVDVRTGGGSSPLKGDLVLLDLTGKVTSTGEVFVDTTSAKRPLAFVYGLKPYAKGVCYGLEYALQSMRAGGKRIVTVPADQCFGDQGEDLGNGAIVPGGAEIEYEVQLQRVSIAPS